MEKNEERVGLVNDYGSEGEGVVLCEDGVVFIPFALKGELVRYKILKVTKNCAYGKVTEILQSSVKRVAPKCPVFGRCGGCKLQHAEYAEQLRIKENNVKKCFNKIANLDVNVSNTIYSNPWRYRNKLQLPVAVDTQGKTVIGFYAENSHRVIPINDCLINEDWVKPIICAFKEYSEKYKINGYNESDGCGDVREITAKRVGDNLIITMVVLREDIRGVDFFIELLKNKLNDRCFSLYLNINTKRTNVIYDEKFLLKYGPGCYNANMLGIDYEIGVTSFMQVNSDVCEKLYREVVSEVDADCDTTVIDAYSGAGLMTALLAKNAKKAIGIEIIPEAVNNANALAKRNGLLDKVTNYQGKCEDILPDIIKKERQNGAKISVVLDPPRKGCDVKVIDAVLQSEADRIIYVSCFPSTLARDVGLIVGTLRYDDNRQLIKAASVKSKYKISRLQPFDMFANTKHIENMVVFDKV